MKSLSFLFLEFSFAEPKKVNGATWDFENNLKQWVLMSVI